MPQKLLLSYVVGYQNKDLRGGFKLVGAPFVNVSDTKMMLSDIRPVGYYNNEAMLAENYTGNDFAVTILNSDGSNDGMIFWFQYNDGTAEGWVEKADDPTSAVWDQDVEIAPGQGLWFCCNTYEEGYRLASAGEALVDARNIPLRSGFKGIALPIAAPCMLSDIRPVGYYNNETMLAENYTGNDFAVTVLKDDGSNDGMIFWFQYNDGTAEGWVEKADDPTSAVWDQDIALNPGDALWVVANTYEEGYQLSFPGIDDL